MADPRLAGLNTGNLTLQQVVVSMRFFGKVTEDQVVDFSARFVKWLREQPSVPRSVVIAAMATFVGVEMQRLLEEAAKDFSPTELKEIMQIMREPPTGG